jgi:neutral ceramidase
MAKAVALSAGGETVVLVKLDLGLVYEGMLFDLEARLGPEMSGKVLITASHSHSAWGQQTGNPIYMVGLGEIRDRVYQGYLDQVEAVARAAIDGMVPARLGYFVDTNFDPDDLITRDRRGENNELMGGPRKDNQLSMLRIDGVDDTPIAAIPVYGVHGTINDADNSMASTDVTGAVERLMAESFDSQVVVMHVQGAGADVSPTPAGGVDCSTRPGNAPEDDPCWVWLRAEGNARNALPTLLAAYESAGAAMQSELELEMLTRSIELGPDPETFTIRDGALEYAPFEPERVADGQVFDASGAILSPIDEFNAPVGAALCENENPLFPAGLMPGTGGMAPYGGCVRIDTAAEVLGQLLDIEFGVDSTHPVCESSRTTISALRIGDIVLATVPGELSILMADYLRARSPVEPENTVLIGYAQGHVGYCMMPEDWLSAGYEPSINSWGPLEAEYIGERLVELMPLVTTSDREDAASGGADRVATKIVQDSFPVDAEAPGAGTIPDAVSERIWLRAGPVASAQPAATVSRVSGIATFVWRGEDPAINTPVVTLQRETSPGSGTFADVTRRSGRVVRDGDLLLMYTPLPVRREDDPQEHYWAVEWQAIPWVGAVDQTLGGLDGLDARAGAPLGSYRFRVQGEGYALFSNPFEVVATSLGVTASRNGNNIEATVRLDAPDGFRLLSLSGDSNRPVPINGGTADVSLQMQNGPDMEFPGVAIGADGRISVDAGANAANVAGVTITDRFGNVGVDDTVQ